VERVVTVTQQKRGPLGKECKETPGKWQEQQECNTNIICPTDPPETPNETTDEPGGIGVRNGFGGKNDTTHASGVDIKDNTTILIILGGAGLLVLLCLAGVCCCCGCCLQKSCTKTQQPAARTPQALEAKNYQKPWQTEPVEKRRQTDTRGNEDPRNDNRDSFFYDDVENYDELP